MSNTDRVRRNLVIIWADDISQHEAWMSGPGERNWDLIVGYAGQDPERFRSPQVERVDVSGPKWPALRQLIQSRAETVEQYDYVWCPDCELMTDTASINALFDLCAEYGLVLAQPALTDDSFVNAEITRVVPGNVLRYTNYVEPMAPCFSREFLRRCASDLGVTTTGLGLDSLWSSMLDPDSASEAIAVIDAVTVRNVRRLPALNATDTRDPAWDSDDGEDYRVTELRAFLAQRKLEPVSPRVIRAVAAGSESPARPSSLETYWVAPDTRRRLDPARCVILVPVADSIEPDCARALFELENQGYPVWRVYGASGIDQVRSQMATDALAAGFDELMWIDADMSFPVEAVLQLRTLDLPISCGIYTKKGERELVVHLKPGTQKLTFGEGGGLAEIKYGATGFLHTRRYIYDRIQEHEGLPTCNKHFGRPVVPYFLPMAVPAGDDFWYLGEDFAFCERAIRCGYKVMADTRIRLGHIGRQTYQWEDAGSSRERYASFTFNF